uniref:Uncharacterized protein n=1 Tax=Tetranychus urticae TaxID=32264 RepID=A0A158P572_TETUR
MYRNWFAYGKVRKYHQQNKQTFCILERSYFPAFHIPLFSQKYVDLPTNAARMARMSVF